MNNCSEVDLWQRRLKLEFADTRPAEALLSIEEKQRAVSLRYPEDRRRFILRHAYLREVVANYLDMSPGKVPLETKLNQQPQLVGSASMADLQISMSSSEQQTVVAVARGRRVGVDIEQVRSDIETAGIARRFFSHVEHARLQSMPVSQRQIAFFRIWTRKEAFAKAIGLGFARDFTSFDVLAADHRSAAEDRALIIDRDASTEHARWLVRDVPTLAGFALACSAEGEEWSIAYRSDATSFL